MISRFERFSFAISGIYRSIQKIERDEMERYGLKGGYAQYLVAMARHPQGLTSTQLCEICDLDKAAVSRSIGEMEERGLLERLAVNNDYRAKLSLTEKGLAAADYVSRRAQQAVSVAGSGLSEEDREGMYRALESIAAHLQVISKEGIPE